MRPKRPNEPVLCLLHLIMRRALNLSGVILAFLISTSLTAATRSELILLEFEDRVLVLNDLSKKYDRYVSTPDSEQPGELRKLINSFDNHFNATDEWIIESMTTNDTSKSLLRAELSRNRNSLSQTEAFINRVMDIYHLAGIIHLRINNAKNIDATNVTKATESGMMRLKDVKVTTITYLEKSGWKTQFKTDINEFVRQSQNAARLEHDLISMLKHKYPFRIWFVVSRAYGTKQWVHCLKSGVEYYEISTLGSRRLFITQAPATKKFNGVATYRHLRNVPEKKSHPLCRSRALDIFNEMKVNCGNNQFTLVGSVAFTENTSLPKMACSDPHFFRSKKVLRRGWVFCHRFYEAFIFG